MSRAVNIMDSFSQAELRQMASANNRNIVHAYEASMELVRRDRYDTTWRFLKNPLRIYSAYDLRKAEKRTRCPVIKHSCLRQEALRYDGNIPVAPRNNPSWPHIAFWKVLLRAIGLVN